MKRKKSDVERTLTHRSAPTRVAIAERMVRRVGDLRRNQHLNVCGSINRQDLAEDLSLGLG